MPFDTLTFPAPVTTTPTLFELEWHLRHMPADWEWNFAHCETCAMAYAVHRLWPEASRTPYNEIDTVMRLFGLKFIEAANVFGGNLAWRLRKPVREVTPIDVADAIARLRRERGDDRVAE